MRLVFFGAGAATLVFVSFVVFLLVVFLLVVKFVRQEWRLKMEEENG